MSGRLVRPPFWLDSMTSFVGRERETEALEGLLTSGVRLVSLVGPAGIGKSRLARHVARSRAAAGLTVAFADLAMENSQSAAAALLDAVAPGATARASSLDAAVARLGDDAALVVLDNFEHLRETTVEMARLLLDRCPNVQVIVTGTTRLRVDRETVWPVPPLDTGHPADTMALSDAAALFVDRARRAKHGFVLSEAAVACVDDIVRALDGIPLAIELAATRVRALSLPDILAALSLQVLTGGPRGRAARYHTMRDALAWTCRLLDADEQELFHRLSVFECSWSAEAAQAVCADERLGEEDVLDVLDRLCHQSLVMREPADDAHGHGDRFRMLLPIREFAAEQTPGGRDSPAAPGMPDRRSRHLRYFAELARRSHDERWALLPASRRRLDPDAANLRAAIHRACASEPHEALAMVGALGTYWRLRGRLADGLDIAGHVLRTTPNAVGPPRAAACAEYATLLFWSGEFTAARNAAEEALQLATRFGVRRARALALTRLGNLTSVARPRAALPVLDEAAAEARSVGALDVLCDALDSALICRTAQEAFDEPFAQLSDESLSIARHFRLQSDVAVILWCNAQAALANGDLEAADELADAIAPREADSSETAAETDVFVGNCAVHVRALVAAARGQGAAAASDVEHELRRAATDPIWWGTGLLLHALSVAHLREGDLDAARATALRLAEDHQKASYLERQAHDVLARVSAAAGDAAQCRAHAARLRQAANMLGNERAATTADIVAASADLLDGDAGRAERGALPALGRCLANGRPLDAVEALEVIARAAARHGRFTRAATLISATDRARELGGWPRSAAEEASASSCRAEAAGRLAEGSYRVAVKRGAEMSLEEAAGYARRSKSRRNRADRGWDSLTPAEYRVALLAASGMTNPQISQRLFLSPSTVGVHLTRVYRKLEVPNRTALAAYVRAHSQG
ncbi:LuxR C-terminal-related transcriptional regulator (plasmid) [Streptomycetaceae bacterium NBC_01309]